MMLSGKWIASDRLILAPEWLYDGSEHLILLCQHDYYLLSAGRPLRRAIQHYFTTLSLIVAVYWTEGARHRAHHVTCCDISSKGGSKIYHGH